MRLGSVTVVALALSAAAAGVAHAQAAPHVSNLGGAVELIYLRLDNGPLGAPAADNVGLGVRGTLLPRGLDGRIRLEGHFSYLVPISNTVPDVATVGVAVAAAPFASFKAHRALRPVASAGLALADVVPHGVVTMEGYCDFSGNCVGRDRFSRGVRPWVTIGVAVEASLPGWLPRRIHSELVVPVERLAEDGEPPYIRVALSWMFAP